MSRVSERTALEIERGRIIGERKKRESDLTRLVEGKKVKIMCALHGHAYYEPHGCVNIFYVEGVDIGHQNIVEDDYPSEAVMAVIGLAVGATVGYEGVPSAQTIDPAVRSRRDEYRDRYLGQWRDGAKTTE